MGTGLAALSASRALLSILTALTSVTPSSAMAAAAEPPTTFQAPVAAAARALAVAHEVRAGYARSRFRHWVDADGDGCDTRDEVLIAEALDPPTVGTGCALGGGRWTSIYDGVDADAPAGFDIDHLVPLAEAWDSGARHWDPDTRERFANDLGDPRALVAVTASSNRSKADRDPAEWLPDRDRCGYVADWIAVKLRWRLTVDPVERAILVGWADDCAPRAVVVTYASVRGAGPGGALPGVHLDRIVFDPPGPDSSANAHAEVVVLRNTSDTTVDLGGWSLRDAGGATFRFPATVLAPGAAVHVHSGRGDDAPGHRHAGWGHRWNNGGDTATLLRPDGAPADTCSYDGGADGSVDC